MRIVWTRHYQHVWRERAKDDRLPDWLRAASLAYGRHKPNGHACFAPGELANLLASRDPLSGGTKPCQNVNRAIRKAVEYGFLAKDSGSRCLVVPAHAITGGLGNEYAPCPVHGDK